MAVSPAEVQKNLAGARYPASKDNLINQARESGADEEILDALEQIEDRNYENPADVVKEVGSVQK